MEEQNLVVGQEFPDVKAFRNAVKEAAITQHFELRVIKSDLVRYLARCASQGCPWRIRAVKLPDSPIFIIRNLEPIHTCGRNAHNGHHQASVDWIVNLIEERLRDNINYKPKEILHDIHKQYGITIPYKQAWRAKERGLAAIYGSSEEGYFLLPSFCEQIRKTNPGSIAEVFTTGSDNRFHRLFVSLFTSMYGFLNGCLPIISLGGIQLGSKYLGTLLSATSFDADGGLFPLAFGVVDVENEENWVWFLSELHTALRMNAENELHLTFLTDGEKSVADAVKREFPSSSHAYCLRHLSETVGREFRNTRLATLVWKAAYATTMTGFGEKMEEIKEASPEAAKWILQFPPSHWALPYFEGKRYGHLSSNIDEFNRWILEARELPAIQVIEQIHSKLRSEFQERRRRSSLWQSALAPTAEKRIVEAMDCAPAYQVLRSDEVEFEVICADRSEIVNTATRGCSCRDWQLYALPCSHAVAALLSCRKDVYAFTESCFTASSYRETYAREIYPMPQKIEWRKAGEGPVDDDVQVVQPPKLRRPPGRPEKKRLCMEDLNREKHVVHCSQCNQAGHYKTTCKADAIKSIEQF